MLPGLSVIIDKTQSFAFSQIVIAEAGLAKPAAAPNHFAQMRLPDQQVLKLAVLVVRQKFLNAAREDVGFDDDHPKRVRHWRIEFKSRVARFNKTPPPEAGAYLSNKFLPGPLYPTFGSTSTGTGEARIILLAFDPRNLPGHLAPCPSRPTQRRRLVAHMTLSCALLPASGPLP